MACQATTMIIVVLTMSIVQGGRLVRRPNGWFITGRGCGGSKKNRISWWNSWKSRKHGMYFHTQGSNNGIPTQIARQLHLLRQNSQQLFERQSCLSNSIWSSLWAKRWNSRKKSVRLRCKFWPFAWYSKIIYSNRLFQIKLFAGTNFPNYGAPWIAIGDAATEGQFVYDSDGKPVNFDHFFPCQPNNYYGKQFHNMLM